MKTLLVLSLTCILLVACSSQTSLEASAFPMEKGTTRVYSYQAYTASPVDSAQMIKATYELTETIVDTATISNYFIAHVRRDRKLLTADPGWTQEISSQPNEFWYVRADQQVFQSNLPLDTNNINPDELILDYQFPLSVRKNWCLLPDSRNNTKELAGCDFVGKRQVTGHGRYETPAGSFENCYDLMDVYNGGNILQKFCDGVGIAFMKFDHSGTQFGFEQTLTKFLKGTP
jgi:hypothetical protein